MQSHEIYAKMGTNIDSDLPDHRQLSDGSNGKILLQQAQEKYDYGNYGEAQVILEDILNPVEGSAKTTDGLALLGGYALLAELHRALAHYEDAESMYAKCLHDVESLVLPADDMYLKTTMNLRILVGYADFYRNLCLYGDLDLILQKAEKLSRSLDPGTLEEGAEAFNLVIADLRISQASYLISLGEYDAAEKLHMEALNLRRQVLGPDHFKVASSLSHLGHVALLKSNFRKATRLLGESLAIRKTIFPNNHPAIAASLFLKGRLLHTMGQHKESGPVLGKALQIRRQCFGNKHPAVGSVLLEIAELSRDMGLPLQASGTYSDAKSVIESKFPDKSRYHGHKLVVYMLVGLGNNAMSMHRYAEALNYYDEANKRHEIQIPEKTVPAHIYREVLHLKRAKALLYLDRFEAARDIISASGQVVVKKLGNDHFLVAEGLLILGTLCSLTGKYAQAHLLLERSQQTFAANFGDEHPIQVEVMYAIAENMRLPGYYEDAVNEDGKAMALGAALFGQKTSHQAIFVAQRAVILRDVGKHADAAKLFLESLALIKETVGASSAFYAHIYGEYGECLRLMDRHTEASDILQRAIALCRTAFVGESGKAQGTDGGVHSSVVLFRMYTAQVLLDEGKPEEALKVLETEVYPPLHSLLGMKHPTTLFSKGLCALCLQRSKVDPLKQGKPKVDLVQEQSQDIIDDVLEAFDTHDGGKSPLSETHPWVRALGGYVLGSARSSHSNTARSWGEERISAIDGFGAPEIITENVPSDEGKDSYPIDASEEPAKAGESEILVAPEIITENVPSDEGKDSGIDMIDLMSLAFDARAAEEEKTEKAEEITDMIDIPDRRKTPLWEDVHNKTVIAFKPGISEDSQILHYQIGYLEIENSKLRQYMYRGDDDEAYLDFLADGKKEMPFFPYTFPHIDGVTYQSDYVLCASVCMSFRVRRLLLIDEITQLQGKLQEYEDLKVLCEKKKRAHADRVLMLEGEMELMAEEIKSKTQDHRDIHPFSALIQNKDANKLLCDYLAGEAKRLQSDADLHVGLEVDESLDLDTVVYMWELLQYYTIVNSIRVRSKIGNKHYPVNGRSDSTKVIVKGRQPGTVPNSARSTDSNKSKEKSNKKIKSGEVLKAGDMKKLKAAAKKGAAAKTDTTGIMDNDDSTIASGTSLGNMSGNSRSVASVTQRTKEPEQPKKTTGGWGFSAMTNWMTGKKEEEVDAVEEGPKELKLVPFVASGNGMGACDWLDVAVCMGNKKGDQTLKSSCKGFLELLKIHAGEAEEGEEGAGALECIPKVVRNDFIMGINELGVKEMTSPIVEAATAQMVNIIAQELHTRIIGGLRLADKWHQFLEAYRKDRIKRSGGSLKEDQEGQVEVDKQGTIRVIPNSDKIVDTDIVHGSRQRLQISVVEPVLFQKLKEGVEKMQVLLGELACVVQLGYTYVTPFVQRAIRRTLCRMRKNTSRRDVGLYSMHAAATTVQTWLRGLWGKKAYAIRKAELMGSIYEDITIFIQKYARMGTKRIPYLKMKRAKAAASEWFAVTKFQAMIRGFNARHRYVKFKAKVYEEREQETKYFSVGLLQRWARGCIARRTVVKSLKVRKTIDKDILLKAEKYLKSGDLWSFLKQMNDDIMILKKTIQDNQKAEDDFASTFVSQVIMRRQGEFDGAWDKFSEAVKGSEGESSAGPRALEDGVLSAVGKGGNQSVGAPSLPPPSPGKQSQSLVSKSLDTGLKAGLQTDISGRPLSPSRAGDSIPGPMLRRAVSATIQDGVSRELRSRSRGGERERKDGASVATNSTKSTRKDRSGRKGKKNESSNKKSSPSKKPVKGRKKMTAEEEQEKGKVYATTTDWAWAQATGTEAAEERKKNEIIREPHIGESLLIDIPKGIDDTMERLIHAASLKCFIPEFSNCETAEEAYKLYLQLPPGLAKMRYEVEARRWTQPMINKLRVKGIVDIKDALPMNKLKQYLDSVKLPIEVQLLSAKWVRILKDMGPLVHGKPHSATAEAQKNLKSGKGTVSQLAKTSLMHKKTASILGEDEDEDSHIPPGAGPDGSKHAPGWTVKDGAGPAGTPSEQLEASKSGGLKGGHSLNDPNSIDLGETTEQKQKRELEASIVQDLLDDFVSKGKWANLQASAEDFLLHAAFIIVPHTLKDSAGNHVGHTEMGQGAFKAHMHELAATEDPDMKRELVRSRFREALLFCTPYTLRLRALGVNTVLDILTNSEIVNKMEFPPMYETQVESLLSVAVGASASAKSAPLNKEAVKTAPEVFKVPLLFDPKFQRSPFDPYGQPPRYIPQKLKDLSLDDKHKQISKTSKATGVSSQVKGKEKEKSIVKEEDDDLNENGLFANDEEEAKSPVNDNTKALFKLQVEEKDRSKPVEEVVVVSKEPIVERKKDFYKQSFEARVRAGFERPFKCKHPGCNEAFSRAYTLKVHEKSHKVFGNYHKWKKQPQLGLDLDRKAMAEEALNLVEERSRLPPIVQAELNKLTKLSKIYSVSGTVEVLQGPKPELVEYDPALEGTAWPERYKSKATIALEMMPDDDSRPNTSTPFFPPRGMSPYPDSEPGSQMPSRAPSRGGIQSRNGLGSRQLASRGGSRGQSRGQSRTTGGVMRLEPLHTELSADGGDGVDI